MEYAKTSRNFTVEAWCNAEDAVDAILRTISSWVDWDEVYSANRSLLDARRFKNGRLYNVDGILSELQEQAVANATHGSSTTNPSITVSKYHPQSSIDELRRKLIADGIDTVVAAEVASRCAEYVMSAYKAGYADGCQDTVESTRKQVEDEKTRAEAMATLKSDETHLS